jgi:hypothetical protein
VGGKRTWRSSRSTGQPQVGRCFLKFLELPGVGRVMADGTDEDGARAARMDEWVVWEAEETPSRPWGLI